MFVGAIMPSVNKRYVGAIVLLGALWAVATVVLSELELRGEYSRDPEFLQNYNEIVEMLKESVSPGGCNNQTYADKLNEYIKSKAKGSKCDLPAGLFGSKACTRDNTDFCQWNLDGSAFYAFQLFTTIGEFGLGFLP